MDIRAAQSNATSTSSAGGTPKTSTTNTTSSDSNGELMGGVGKSDFLQLLVAQLRNQDPLKPMEDKEFIAQMAQLNTVEQLTSMNKNLTDFMNFDAMSQASSLIGKMVLAAPSGQTPIQGIVQEVQLEQGKPVLIVGGERVQLADIQRIAAAS